MRQELQQEKSVPVLFFVLEAKIIRMILERVLIKS
jgi:hypothetical protein